MSEEGQSPLLRENGVRVTVLTGHPHAEALLLWDACCQPLQWGANLSRQWINRYAESTCLVDRSAPLPPHP